MAATARNQIPASLHHTFDCESAVVPHPEWPGFFFCPTCCLALDREGHFIFLHENCGGKILPHPELDGYRHCLKCKKRFEPHLIHEKKASGESCGGRFRFLDIEEHLAATGPKRSRFPKRTYERVCGSCGVLEKYDATCVLIVFRAGTSEETASGILRKVELIKIIRLDDVGGHEVYALLCGISQKATLFNIDALISQLENEPPVLMAAKILTKNRPQ